MNLIELLSFFQYDFIIKGFFIGLLVAIASAGLGHFLVLKKMSLIGDGLAHIAYFSVAISLAFFSQSLVINLLIASMASLLIHFLIANQKGYSDAIIGGISTTAIALGTLVITLNPNQNVRIEQFLFGSLLLLRNLDMIAILVVAVLIGAFLSFFFHELMILTFDQDFAKVNHLQPRSLQLALAILTSWLVIIGIRTTGALLISSFLIFPTLIAMNFKRGFKQTLLVGILIAVGNFFIGFIASLWFDLPTGSTLVVTYALVWLFTLIFAPALRRKHE